MAGSWIKMRTDLADDPAVIAIAARMGMDPDHVVGKLHNLWSWANEQTADGRAAGLSAAWVDKRTGAKGFALALQAVDWLIVTDAGIEFPRFDKHNGSPAKVRAQWSKRKEVSRERHASVTPESPKCHAPSVTDGGQKRDQNREEKNREEHNSSNSTSNGHRVAPPATPDAAVAAAGVSALTADQERRYRLLFTRPLWLPEDKPWIDASTARRLARMPTTSDGLIEHLLRDAKAARKTLENPAGLVIKNLSRPDPELAAAMLARAEQTAQEAA